MRTLNRSKNKGFTLIELMIVVAIVGILAVLAVVGVRRYLSNSKSAEARNALGAIGKGAAQALEREATTTGVIGASSSAIVSRRLCLTATQFVPAAATSVQGKKYQASNANGSDWHKDDGAVHTGFACARFEMMNPQAYQYNYTSDSTSTTQGNNITANAEGDLNGDGLTSRFRLVGAVQSQALVLSPSLEETNPDE
jgi:type IV pilus assembly protein PilA